MAANGWIRLEQKGHDVFLKGGEPAIAASYFAQQGLACRQYRFEEDCAGFAFPPRCPIHRLTEAVAGLTGLLEALGYLVNPEDLAEPLLTFSPQFLGLAVH
jgi:hypothetical protein